MLLELPCWRIIFSSWVGSSRWNRRSPKWSSLGAIRCQYQLTWIWKGKIWVVETHWNSSAKPQCSHWEEHQCGLGFSPKSPFAILEAALITSCMYKGSEGKGLSVNISYLSLLLRMHFDLGLHHSNKIQVHAWTLAFLLQFLGCYRSSFFQFSPLHHWHDSMMDPDWVLGPWFISFSFSPHLWKSEGSVWDEWGQCLKCRGCFTQKLHCQENTLNQSCSLENPRLTSRTAEYLIWEGQNLAGGFQKTLLLWAMPGLGHPGLDWQGRMISAPSPPLCSAQSTSEQSSSDRQPVINYQPSVSSGGQATTLATCCFFDKILQK